MILNLKFIIFSKFIMKWIWELIHWFLIPLTSMSNRCVSKFWPNYFFRTFLQVFITFFNGASYHVGSHKLLWSSICYIFNHIRLLIEKSWFLSWITRHQSCTICIFIERTIMKEICLNRCNFWSKLYLFCCCLCCFKCIGIVIFIFFKTVFGYSKVIHSLWWVNKEIQSNN